MLHKVAIEEVAEKEYLHLLELPKKEKPFWRYVVTNMQMKLQEHN
jgi:hypothetical protein